MSVKVVVSLPFKRETDGALVYKIPGDLSAVSVGQVYVRKDKLIEAGHTGPWPRSITVTVEADGS